MKQKLLFCSSIIMFLYQIDYNATTQLLFENVIEIIIDSNSAIPFIGFDKR